MRRLRQPRMGAAPLAARLLSGLAAAALLLTPLHAGAQQRFELSEGGWQRQEAPAPDSPAGELQSIRRQLAKGNAAAAETAADAWIESHPDHPLMPEARLVRGDARTAQRHYYDALYEYEYIVRAYPASDQFHTALQREYQIARLFTRGMKRRFLGMRIIPADGDGEELLIRIQERAPGSDIGEKAHLELADYYYRQREMSSAAEAYDLFMQNYPESDQTEWAMLRLIQANLARFKGPRFDSTGLIEAAQRLKTYRDRFPAAADRMGADALLVRINQSLAEKSMLTADWYARRDRPVAAAYLYGRVVRDYPETAVAGQALARLRDMPDSVKQGFENLPNVPPLPALNEGGEDEATTQPARKSMHE